jgi:hypothetical protein
LASVPLESPGGSSTLLSSFLLSNEGEDNRHQDLHSHSQVVADLVGSRGVAVLHVGHSIRHNAQDLHLQVSGSTAAAAVGVVAAANLGKELEAGSSPNEDAVAVDREVEQKLALKMDHDGQPSRWEVGTFQTMMAGFVVSSQSALKLPGLECEDMASNAVGFEFEALQDYCTRWTAEVPSPRIDLPWGLLLGGRLANSAQEESPSLE